MTDRNMEQELVRVILAELENALGYPVDVKSEGVQSLLASAKKYAADREVALLNRLNQVTPVVLNKFERDDKYYFDRGYALVKKLAAQQQALGEQVRNKSGEQS